MGLAALNTVETPIVEREQAISAEGDKSWCNHVARVQARRAFEAQLAVFTIQSLD